MTLGTGNGAVKEAMALLGRPAGPNRAPIAPLSAREAAEAQGHPGEGGRDGLTAPQPVRPPGGHALRLCVGMFASACPATVAWPLAIAGARPHGRPPRGSPAATARPASSPTGRGRSPASASAPRPPCRGTSRRWPGGSTTPGSAARPTPAVARPRSPLPHAPGSTTRCGRSRRPRRQVLARPPPGRLPARLSRLADLEHHRPSFHTSPTHTSASVCPATVRFSPNPPNGRSGMPSSARHAG